MDGIAAEERINWKMADWAMAVAQKIVGFWSNLSRPTAIIHFGKQVHPPSYGTYLLL